MHTVEPQYDHCLDVDRKYGRYHLGLMSNQVWHDDPKRLLFVLARYKFVSKMAAGKSSALEIGCADGFGTRIVRQVVPDVLATDIDPIFIADCLSREPLSPWPISFQVHDILDGPAERKFECVYSLDVFEHIASENERTFIRNVRDSMSSNSILIVGCPSLESQDYASPGSRAGHINCKSGEALQKLFSEYFENVCLFSMNDEVVHTGFSRMAHYLLILCCGKKNEIA
jgi:2-polyprenyl-3-methyl-5-hydroxy-6-metoxy-1,4-benzoquinol methylase